MNYDIDYLGAIVKAIKGQYPNFTGQALKAMLVLIRADAMKLFKRHRKWGEEIVIDGI